MSEPFTDEQMHRDPADAPLALPRKAVEVMAAWKREPTRRWAAALTALVGDEVEITAADGCTYSGVLSLDGEQVVLTDDGRDAAPAGLHVGEVRHVRVLGGSVGAGPGSVGGPCECTCHQDGGRSDA
ncbi:hypothetical protein [Thermomonospora umbrina]|uniref:Uncharacterized protein n=1 Tax=Thermomonospora umbrina TaxID=111806 RepID=A0A3D9SWM6_9ACTN|nr:hypothetical protein [Thermomonospora umbrina]REF00239.1 hypothetical protein DFJ69_5767 [Thermomonospora umbrina]